MKILLISLLFCFNALLSIAQNKKYTDTYAFQWLECGVAEYSKLDDPPNHCHVCRFKGKFYVETNPTKNVDFLVRKVEDIYYADIIVTTLTTNQIPVDCGDWIFVKKREDAHYTIRYVNQGYHFKVYFSKTPKQESDFEQTGIHHEDCGCNEEARYRHPED